MAQFNPHNITTIHGVNKLYKSNSGAWLVLMMATALVTVAYLIIIKDKYNNDHIITRINANCKINQVPFPAVSICNSNLVSEKRSKNIANILTSNNITRSEVELFLQSLPDLKDYHRMSLSNDFTTIMNVLKKHYFTVETIMEEVHQTCEDLLLYCSFNRREMDCRELFVLIKTYEGHCCAFNYAALNDGSIDVFQDKADGDLERYDDLSENEQSSNIIVTSESGRGSGLSVVLNVEPNDYPNWSLTPYYGAKVLLTDPNDFPEATVLYKFLGTGESLDLKVVPMIFQSDDEIRRIDVATRGCIFHDEGALQHTDRYSTETCLTECRMKNFLLNCGCVPYKYPKERGSRVCEFQDMACLNNLRAKGSLEGRCEGACYMECRDKRYTVTSDVMPLIADLYPEDIVKGRNLSEISSLRVYFDKSTCNCYKQMLLMDFSYFIATYGGIFSLTFGASLLSLFELVYLFMNTFVRHLWKLIYH